MVLRALDGLWNVVHVLRLDDGLDVVLQNLSKVVLELRTPKIGQNVVPARRIIIATKIRLLIARQNLQRSGLANTVGAHQSQDLARLGRRQSM